jgi:5-methylthioadenosine/S-adenosylhomocysteine deaminase
MVGTRAEVSAAFPGVAIEDFGEAAILPGLVNAHSHLELTVMRGFLEAEESDFFAWLRKLTVARQAMTSGDLLVSATCGAIEAARAGITCTADSSSFAIQSMKALRTVGLRGVVYQESFGPDPNLTAENVDKLRVQLADMRDAETKLVRAGVSPHAPYTVSAAQLEAIGRLAIEEKFPLMMHAAESEAETSLIKDGSGPFAEGLRKRSIEWSAPGISPIQYLHKHGVLDAKPLLAHCIRVDETDLQTIKEYSAGIAHCPKSNAKLRHGRAPFARFLAHGINVGLGSDSVASNNTCDILEEGRFAVLLARSAAAGSETADDGITAQQALFTATLGGARALGIDEQVGALQTGMQADITVVHLAGPPQQPAIDPHSSLIFSSSSRDVLLTLVAGKEIYRKGQVTTVNEHEYLAQLKQIRRKLDSLT